MRPDQAKPHPNAEEMGCAGLVIRLAWFLAGHLALVVFALLIAQSGKYSVLDVAYWLTIIAILIVRWIDVTRFGGLTRDGEVATLRDWRRHVALLTLIGGATWVVIHAGRRLLEGP